MVKRLAPAVEREVHRLHAKGHSLREIGRMVEHSKHAVMNALGRVPADGVWNPSPARLKLSCPRLTAEVTRGLTEWWSPEEISKRLVVDFPDDPTMRVSYETIYQSL